MKRQAIQLGIVDLVGAAAALLIVAGGYLLLIRGPWEEAGRLSAVRESCAQTTRDVADVHADTERIHRQIEASEKKLAAVGGPLPEAREIDRYLARVVAVAGASGVAIDTFVPLPPQDWEDHRALHVNFAGRGTFTALHRMLRNIERELEYADVTNFSITSNPSGGAPACQLTWSLRICTSREGPAAPAAVPASPAPVSGAALRASAS